MTQSKILKDYVLKPFYILEQGDLVQVKDYNRYYGGMLGVVADKDRYGVAREVVLSSGKKVKLMCLEIERIGQ
tara:strand:+ start:1086 stop:1304 length:219 start_codon:yes stop_codon:yes gene_type:complete